MPHLKAYDKEGNVLAIGYNVELHEEIGSVIIPNLAPHTYYPRGEFFVSWEAERYETDKVEVPGFTTHESSFKEITFYFKDHILVKTKTAYDIAVENGFQGTEQEWVESIKGEKGEKGETGVAGKDGKSFGFEDLSEEQLNMLKGEKGEKGEDGKSSYELAVDEGFQGDLNEYLDSLHGEKGEPLRFSDLTEEQIQSLKGQDGTMTFEDLTEEQRASLKGEKGDIGESAYDLAVNEGFEGSITEFLSSLKGEKGDPGIQGIQGEKGEPGEQGIQGEPGKDFKYEDFTETQLNSLKGDKGDSFTYKDFTSEQIEALREPIKTDVVNIGTKVERLYGLSQSPVNIYVSKIGTSNGNGTQSNPFNSIQKAFDSIPKIIDKRYTVWIAPGDYEEEAYLTGVIGGTIFIRSTEPPESVDNINVRVKALNFYDVMGYVHIEDMGTLGGEITRKAFILFSRCIYGSISRCRMDRNIPGKITLYWDGSFGSLGTSYIANQDLVIQSQNGSTVRVDDNTTSGTGNVVALYSLNGFIFKSGANNWIQSASIPEKKEIGGQIYSDQTEWIDLSYSNGWATNSGVALKYKKMNDNLVMLYGWVNKQPLDTTVIATLPVGYRPINTQRHAVTVTGTAAVQTSLPVLEVRSNGDIRLVSTGNVPANSGIAINVILPIL